MKSSLPRSLVLFLTLLAAFPAFPGPRAVPAAPLSGPLDPALLARNLTDPVRVIALLRGWQGLIHLPQGRDPEEDRALDQTLARLQDRVVESLAPGTARVIARYRNLPALALEVAPGGLSGLAGLEAVDSIEPDSPMFARDTGGAPALAAVPASIPPEMRGAGVAIAFVDSGVDYNAIGKGGYPNDRIVGGYDFGDNDPDPMDCNGHGTGMVMIANTWVAPEAKAFAFKICPGCCQREPRWVSKMLAAWDWCLEHNRMQPAFPIVAVNVSWDNNVYSDKICDQKYPAVAAAATKLAEAGIAIFTASGNNGYCDGMNMPACLSATFSVGSAYHKDVGPQEYCVSSSSCYKEKGTKCANACRDDPTREDLVACCTNSAEFLDFLAQSGGPTSGAAAYASGVAAVVQGFFWKSKGVLLNLTQLREVLTRVSDPVTDPRMGRVKPRLNIYKIHFRLKEMDWGMISAR